MAAYECRTIGAAALVVVCEHRGGALARGARAGFWTGVLPLVLPALAGACGHACVRCEGGPAWPLRLLAAVMGGLLAGVLLSLHGLARGSERRLFLFGALAAAGALGTVGCSLAGGAGVAGMAAGLALGAAPALMRASVRPGR